MRALRLSGVALALLVAQAAAARAASPTIEHAAIKCLVAGKYQLISGERRLRAAVRAGWTTIPARVREADDRLVAGKDCVWQGIASCWLLWRLDGHGR